MAQLQEHRIEARARVLGARMKTRMNVIRDAVAPPGQRPPFTKQLSKSGALSFWTAHRYDETGAQVLATMTPEAVMELDQALAAQTAYKRSLDMVDSGGGLDPGQLSGQV